MKILLLPIIALLLTSCTTMTYHQVYKVKSDKGIAKENVLFEDDNCTVIYNLWNNGGDAGFEFFNKTDNDISIDLNKTFFVINGESKAYFQNRSYSKTSTFGIAVNRVANNSSSISKGGSSSVTTTYSEIPIIIVAGKTSKRISEYEIFNTLYTECKYLKYPSKESVATLNFDKKNSPIVFSNIISYSINGVEKRIINEFYVSEITNYPAEMMYETITKNECGVALFVPKRVLIFKGADMFYNIYYRK